MMALLSSLLSLSLLRPRPRPRPLSLPSRLMTSPTERVAHLALLMMLSSMLVLAAAGIVSCIFSRRVSLAVFAEDVGNGAVNDLRPGLTGEAAARATTERAVMVEYFILTDLGRGFTD